MATIKKRRQLKQIKRRATIRIARLVESTTFNVVIALLILASVLLIFAEFLIAPGETLAWVMLTSDLITLIFVFELSLRFVVAPNKKIYFSNYWIDILSVLPVLRVFRTLRLLRLLRLLRVGRALIILLRQSGWLSLKLEHRFGSFGALFFTSALLILCGTFALLSFESVGVDHNQSELLHNFADKAWFTTFMFINGEIAGELPMSTGGRFISMMVSVSGLVVFAVLVGTISASMSNYWKAKMDAKDLEIADLEDHIIICGWDRMGRIILAELESLEEVWKRGVVIVAETDEDIIKKSRVKNSARLFHIKRDFTRIDVLKSAGAVHARTAIVLADKGQNLGDQDRDARTVLAALTLEKLNPEIYTCAELLNHDNATHLSIAGVEEIISRTNITAGLFAATAVHEGLTSVISDILTHREGSYFKKMPVPQEFLNRSFLDAFSAFKERHDATIIAIDQGHEDGSYEQHVNPSGDIVLTEHDRLVVVIKEDLVLT